MTLPSGSELRSEEKTLSPLPEAHHRGLIAVAVTGLISFIVTTILFLFVTYQLLRYDRPRRRSPQPEGQRLSLQTPDPTSSVYASSKRDAEPAGNERSDPVNRNPFPILIYNLLIADIMEALGFALSVHWVMRNSINVEDSACWAQGWFISNGDLSSSIFLSLISIHTFSILVLGYNPPRWATRASIGVMWIFIILVSNVGIIATRNGMNHGGWFARANAWCWISQEYNQYRLWTHYLWILASIALTILLYGILMYTLWRQKRSSRELPENIFKTATSSSRGAPAKSSTGHHPAFFIVPVSYVICTAPLAFIRVATVAGVSVSISAYCVAGAMMGCNGLCNTVLWITTILFSAPQDIEDAGLKEFAFLRGSMDFGNAVYIEGGNSKREKMEAQRNRSGWWWWSSGGQQGWRRRPSASNGWQRSVSQESLRCGGANDMSIHMNTVTTVAVE